MFALLADIMCAGNELHSRPPPQQRRGFIPMSQYSEDRLPDDTAVAEPTKALVLPFERPQSELQRAVQLRAQETIDRERDRAARQRLTPWRRMLMLALAAIPVYITFGAAVGFVGALRQFNTAVLESNSPSVSTAAPSRAAAPQTSPSAAASDVVLLQPYALPKAAGENQGNARVPAERP